MKRNEWKDKFENVKDDFIFDFSWEKIRGYCLTLDFPQEQLNYLECLAFKWNEVYATGNTEDKYPRRTYGIWNLLANEIKRLKSLKELRKSKKKPTKTKKVLSLQDQLKKPDQVITLIKDFLSKSDNMKKRQKAAKTIIEGCKAKDVKADGAKVARFFIENGIIKGLKLSSLEKYFKKTPLTKIESDTSLKASLVNHI